MVECSFTGHRVLNCVCRTAQRSVSKQLPPPSDMKHPFSCIQVNSYRFSPSGGQRATYQRDRGRGGATGSRFLNSFSANGGIRQRVVPKQHLLRLPLDSNQIRASDINLPQLASTKLLITNQQTVTRWRPETPQAAG